MQFKPEEAEIPPHVFLLKEEKKKPKDSDAKNQHIKKIHSLEIFKCDICEKTFSVSRSLRNHYQLVHETENIVKCDICEKYHSASGMRKHFKKIHDGHKNFKCDHCGKSFTQSGNLKRTHQNYS